MRTRQVVLPVEKIVINHEPASLAGRSETLGTKLIMSSCVSVATNLSVKTPVAAVKSGENSLTNVSPSSCS